MGGAGGAFARILCVRQNMAIVAALLGSAFYINGCTAYTTQEDLHMEQCEVTCKKVRATQSRPCFDASDATALHCTVSCCSRSEPWLRGPGHVDRQVSRCTPHALLPSPSAHLPRRKPNLRGLRQCVLQGVRKQKARDLQLCTQAVCVL
jgi:hypothetical protein